MGIIKIKQANEGTIQEKVAEEVVDSSTIKTPSTKKGRKRTAILREDLSKKDEHTSHYILNNGTAKTVITAEPTNYFDEETKEWKEVDNTLEDKGEVYENKRGNLKTQISKAARGKSVKVGKKDMNVSWSYLGKKTKEGLSLVYDTILKVDGKKARSKAVYENADKNTDLEYKISANKVKENIIVKEKSEDYKYQFALNTEGLELRLSEDNTSIELCKEDKVEFRIPAPFMYDAKGVRSDEVYYELEPSENGKYVFTVVADADWINDEKREMPVTIDPQIVVNAQNAITATLINMVEEYNSIEDYHWIETDCSSVNDGAYMYHWGSEKNVLKIEIAKSELNISKTNLYEAKLVIPVDTYGFDYIRLKVDEDYHYVYADQGLELDITGFLQSSNVKWPIEIEVEEFCDCEIDITGMFVTARHFINKNHKPTLKTFSLAGVLKGEANLNTSEFSIGFTDVSSENSVMGMQISHHMKDTEENYNVGEYFRLNLNEKFVKNSNEILKASYYYTDAKGNVYDFNENFYYISDDGTKTYLNCTKDAISIELDGTLKYGDQVVEVEYKSKTGLKALTEKEGYKYNKYFEQRSDEKKQVEEQIKAYKEALINYKLVDKSKLPLEIPTSNCISEIVKEWRNSSAEEIGRAEVENLLNEATNQKLLLDENDALNYINIKNQTSFYSQTSVINDQTFNKVLLDKASLVLEAEQILKECQDAEGFADSSTKEKLATINSKVGNVVNNHEIKREFLVSTYFVENCTYYLKDSEGEITTVVDDSRALLIQKLVKSYNIKLEQLIVQEESNKKQKLFLDKQLAMYEEKSAKNKENFEFQAKEYFSLIEKQKELEYQTPVNFLTDGHYVKGFNKAGQFVVLYDMYENYAVIEYENCTCSANYDYRRIARLYDNKDNVVSFEYNSIDLLIAIKDIRGSKTSYKYDKFGWLMEINYDTGEHVVFTYDDEEYKNIVKVAEDKNGLITTIEESDKTLKITDYSPIAEIKDGIYTVASQSETNGTKINEVLFEFDYKAIGDMDKAKITYENGQEIFIFDGEQHLKTYYQLEDQKVVKGERYEYVTYWDGTTKQQDPREVKTKLCRDKINTPYSEDFVFVDGDESRTALNQFNLPETRVDKQVIGLNGTDENVQTSTTTYLYDDNQKLIKEETLVQVNGANNYTIVKKYNYNLMGDVVRCETYVEGEELTKGKDIEETVYDKTGNVIKSFKYNTLDSSSKFYTETEYSEDGKAVAELDETGENKTEIEYVDGTNVVREQKLPNGSKFAYGHDFDDTVTAISHSTEEGEENSTQKLYNYGKVVKLTSGNNTVDYEYDAKGRTTKVKLNGADYVSYGYTEQKDSNGLLNSKTTEISFSGYNSIKAVEDAYGREISLKLGNEILREKTYVDGKLSKIKLAEGNGYRYEYDSLGNVIKVQEINSTGADLTNGHREESVYSKLGKLTNKTIANSVNHNYNYEYKTDSTKKLESITFNNLLKVKPQLDCLGRNKGKEILYSNSKIAEENISYRKVGDHATNMPSTIWFGDKTNGSFQVKDSIKYAYDKMGNVEKVYVNGELKVRYTYDALNRLIREDNKDVDKTYLMSYDNNGNILKKREFEFSLKNILELEEKESTDSVYIYEGDKLQTRIIPKFDGNESSNTETELESFVYNSMGNPIIYRGKVLLWDGLKQLTEYDNVLFSYDGLGRRTKKGNVTFTYDNSGRLIKQSNGLEFFYDNSGVAGFVFDNKTYIYRKDAYGNVIAILDDTGAVLVKYIYDAWGNHAIIDNSQTGIGNLNPFRYRSYYYDTETDLYYLKSRYYDPELGRFISIDSIQYIDPETINGLNLYAYCGNNPVMNIDPNGTFFFTALIVGLIVGAALITYSASGAVKAYKTSQELGLSSGETAWYTFTGLFVGDYAVVKDNWDVVSKTIKMSPDNRFKFKFQENQYYSFWTAGLYAEYIKENFYADIPSRTERGLYIELQMHYALYLLGNSHGTDGSDMSYPVWSVDSTAVISEALALCFRWLFKRKVWTI